MIDCDRFAGISLVAAPTLRARILERLGRRARGSAPGCRTESLYTIILPCVVSVDLALGMHIPLHYALQSFPPLHQVS